MLRWGTRHRHADPARLTTPPKLIRSLRRISIGVVAATLVAGCGGGGGDSSTSRTAFIKAADQICGQGAVELQKVVAEDFGSTAPNASQIRSFVLQSYLPSIRGQVSDVEALPQPSGDGEQLAAFYAEARSALDDLEEDPTQLLRRTTVFDETVKLADEYGFKVCGGA